MQNKKEKKQRKAAPRLRSSSCPSGWEYLSERRLGVFGTVYPSRSLRSPAPHVGFICVKAHPARGQGMGPICFLAPISSD